jgi:voltage-gated potassium channel
MPISATIPVVKKLSRLKFMLLVMIVIVAIDITGYMALTGISFVNALYMTVISITTVGFQEVFPASTAGRIFTIFVILSGLGVFFYVAGTIVEVAIEGRIRAILGRRKMKTLAKMKNHTVIVGFGRMGELICRDLSLQKVDFILLESNAERFAAAEERGYHVLLVDATSENALDLASVSQARVFVSVLSNDADNIFTVLSARDLNPDLFIITRAFDKATEKKLYKIGANRVISPYELSANRIVNIVTKPNVVDFFDIFVQQQLSLSLEELTITATSPLLGKKISASGLREKQNAIIVAIKRGDGVIYSPGADTVIAEKDVLILLGEKTRLETIT